MDFGPHSVDIVAHLPLEALVRWKEHMPLSSRCALLRKHDTPEEVIREMMLAWEKWRAK